VIGRLGGEEFALLLPETAHDDACLVAERLRASVDKGVIRCSNRKVEITVSIGVAGAQWNMTDLSDLVKRADEALYSAKRNGRNRVASATGDMGQAIRLPASAA
jgi:diguanylate cyclase (GGDEF)-like protein